MTLSSGSRTINWPKEQLPKLVEKPTSVVIEVVGVKKAEAFVSIETDFEAVEMIDIARECVILWTPPRRVFLDDQYFF
ncbi:MAG: hypothetical protein R2688_09480 [Fimbriimonadaceae bacterium]